MYSEQCPSEDYSMPKISTALYLTQGTKGSAAAGTSITGSMAGQLTNFTAN